MSYFAEIDSSKNVLRVIIADQEFIDSGVVGDPLNWLETFDDGRRKFLASPGYFYDAEKDEFYPPKPDLENMYSWNDVDQFWELI